LFKLTHNSPKIKQYFINWRLKVHRSPPFRAKAGGKGREGKGREGKGRGALHYIPLTFFLSHEGRGEWGVEQYFIDSQDS
jgi:hypothetical protein